MANRLVSDIVEAALARAGEVGASYPGGRALLFQRVGIRQRQLYVRANKMNPERFGACLTSALSGGLVDFNDVASPVPTPDLIQRVEVLDAGTSGYAAGDVITIVPAEHQDAALAPRAMIRDGVLIQVGTDLSLVTSIKAYYGKMPEPVPQTAAGGATSVELVQPWDALLEIDCADYIINRAFKIDTNLRGAALATLKAEEDELLADFDAHVAGYTPIVSQFLPPHQAVRAKAAGPVGDGE